MIAVIIVMLVFGACAIAPLMMEGVPGDVVAKG